MKAENSARKVSIIVPVFNTAPYLAKCLDSLLSQTLGSIEIVAVNDGSTDESAEILARYANEYPDRVFAFSKENGGLSSARNFGIEQARGEFIAFVDSDDFVTPDFAEKLAAKADAEGLDLVVCDFWYLFDSGKKIPAKTGKDLSADPVRNYLLSGPMACLRLFRRNLLDKTRFCEGVFYEDLEMTPALVLQTDKITYLHEPLYYYYQRSGSIMNKTAFSAKLYDIFKVLDRLHGKFAAAGRENEFEKELEYLYIEHLFRSAARRFSAFPERKKLFAELKRTVEEKFPCWKKNPYLKKSGLKFRLSVRLAAGGHDRLVALINKMRS